MAGGHSGMRAATSLLFMCGAARAQYDLLGAPQQLAEVGFVQGEDLISRDAETNAHDGSQWFKVRLEGSYNVPPVIIFSNEMARMKGRPIQGYIGSDQCENWCFEVKLQDFAQATNSNCGVPWNRQDNKFFLGLSWFAMTPGVHYARRDQSGVLEASTVNVRPAQTENGWQQVLFSRNRMFPNDNPLMLTQVQSYQSNSFVRTRVKEVRGPAGICLA